MNLRLRLPSYWTHRRILIKCPMFYYIFFTHCCLPIANTCALRCWLRSCDCRVISTSRALHTHVWHVQTYSMNELLCVQITVLPIKHKNVESGARIRARGGQPVRSALLDTDAATLLRCCSFLHSQPHTHTHTDTEYSACRRQLTGTIWCVNVHAHVRYTRSKRATTHNKNVFLRVYYEGGSGTLLQKGGVGWVLAKEYHRNISCSILMDPIRSVFTSSDFLVFPFLSVLCASQCRIVENICLSIRRLLLNFWTALQSSRWLAEQWRSDHLGTTGFVDFPCISWTTVISGSQFSTMWTLRKSTILDYQ